MEDIGMTQALGSTSDSDHSPAPDPSSAERGVHTASTCAVLPGASSALAAYTEEQRARAYDRYRRIQPHLDDGVPLTHLVGRGLPLRTLRRWVARYKAGGLTARARG